MGSASAAAATNPPNVVTSTTTSTAAGPASGSVRAPPHPGGHVGTGRGRRRHRPGRSRGDSCTDSRDVKRASRRGCRSIPCTRTRPVSTSTRAARPSGCSGSGSPARKGRRPARAADRPAPPRAGGRRVRSRRRPRRCRATAGPSPRRRRRAPRARRPTVAGAPRARAPAPGAARAGRPAARRARSDRIPPGPPLRAVTARSAPSSRAGDRTLVAGHGLGERDAVAHERQWVDRSLLDPSHRPPATRGGQGRYP